MNAIPAPLKRPLIAGAVLLAAVAAFYVATFSFRNISDTDLNSYQTRALALHGDIDLARYGDNIPKRRNAAERDGKIYSTYGIGVSLPALPIYAVAARLGTSDRALQAAASIPFVAAAALIIFRLLLRLFPRGVAVGGFVVYAFGTTMWPVAAMGFFQTGPASLFQAIGVWGLFSRRPSGPALAGVGFGGACLVRPTMVLPAICVGVFYLVWERRDLVRFAAGVLPFAAAVLVQNRWIWGSWLTGGYAEQGVGFNGELQRSLFGLTFGWYRGIFVYSPVLILGVVGAVLAMKGRRDFVERRMIVLAVSSLALFLFTSRWSGWYGGTNQFGYRLLLDIVPFLVVLMAYGISKSERVQTIALPLGLLSVMTTTFGAAPNDFGWDGGVIFPRALEDTSFGQAWINFVHHPAGGVARLLAVAGIGALAYALAPSREEAAVA